MVELAATVKIKHKMLLVAKLIFSHMVKQNSVFRAYSKQVTLLLLNTTCPVFANSVDPDQLASEEANWSGSALFVIPYVNSYQQPEASNLIGSKLEVGMAS